MKDTDLLVHIFSLPNEADLDAPTDDASRRAKRFDLRRTESGFALVPGNTPIETFPVRLRIEAGYAVRRGNAIKRWAPDDFAFNRAPLRMDQTNGVVVSRADENAIELEIKKPDFQFAVSGFDPKRDLVVRANELKGENEADV